MPAELPYLKRLSRISVRVLWRMQGPRRVLAAGLFRHPAGHELVVHFEGDADDVLETRFERFDVDALENRAAEMKRTLSASGWTELPT